MKSAGLLIFYLLTFNTSFDLCGQQSYADSINDYRKKYIDELLSEPRKPVTKEQATLLRFYHPDEKYRVSAEVALLNNIDTIQFATSSGVKKTYTKYARATFIIDTIKYTLTIFQSPTLKLKEGLQNYLFLPFKDATNGELTYEGGRYIDCTTDDIFEGKMVLDFNKCYNPYCAYSGGFACPVPPRENFIVAFIPAGEQKPAFEH